MQNVVSALGVQWNPTADQFNFEIKTMNERPKTKRELLSQIAMLYDPVGFLAPVIMKARILMENAWKESVEWDDKMSENKIDEWQKIKTELPLVQSVAVPRWIGSGPNAKIQLNGFCDASNDAYCATIYVRSVNNDMINVEFFVAKTRVAPKKNKLTIPKLELCGALLLTRVLKWQRKR